MLSPQNKPTDTEKLYKSLAMLVEIFEKLAEISRICYCCFTMILMEQAGAELFQALLQLHSLASSYPYIRLIVDLQKAMNSVLFFVWGRGH